MGGLGSGRRPRQQLRPRIENYFLSSIHVDLLRNAQAHPSDVSFLQVNGADGEIDQAIYGVRVHYGWAELLHRSCPAKDAWGLVTVIIVESTFCNFGGERHWFVCPSCQKRRTGLYMPAGVPKCRVCLSLKYDSQRLGAIRRARMRTRRVQQKLGGHCIDVFEAQSRPKGMHLRTYKRLRRQILDGALDFFSGLAEQYHFFTDQDYRTMMEEAGAEEGRDGE